MATRLLFCLISIILYSVLISENFREHMRLWQSGQMHRTVNPTTLVYAGSNPAGRTVNIKITPIRSG